MDHPKRIRECTDALKAAIADARKDGYRVDGVGSLDIGVSETAKVKPSEPVPAAPLPAPQPIATAESAAKPRGAFGGPSA